jgi:RNA polymerase sigma factor (TIGR02999 family)
MMAFSWMVVGRFVALYPAERRIPARAATSVPEAAIPARTASMVWYSSHQLLGSRNAPMTAQDRQVTKILLAHGRGQAGAGDQLIELVYEKLRRIAHNQLRRARPGQTLNTTGLVHEAYLKLVDPKQASWNDRRHFFAAAAKAMRHIIVDYARHKQRVKRGGGQPHVPLDEQKIAVEEHATELLELDLALEQLSAVSERLVRVVECRFFAGLTEQETAETLETSLRTVQRDWKRARAWLREALQP